MLVSSLLVVGVLVAGCGGGGPTPGEEPDDPCAGIDPCSVVRTLDDLQAMQEDLGGHYVLGNDIDASATRTWHDTWSDGFEPVGAEATPFTGTFDGRGHTVEGLYIERLRCEDPDGCYVGVFGYTAESATISDVALVDVEIGGLFAVGGLVGRNDGVIANASVSGAVSGGGLIGGLAAVNGGRITDSHTEGVTDGVPFGAVGSAVGGLAGMNLGRVTASHSASSVSGDESVGGLIGINVAGASLENSSGTGAVEGVRNVGGLVGASHGAVSGSHGTGPVVGVGNNVGGLIGLQSGSTTDSNAAGDVEGAEYVGGLVGNNSSGSIERSYATGAVSGGDHVGGLAGDNSGPIVDSHSGGSVVGRQYVGGLVGYNGYNGGANITSSHSTGDVNGASFVGGLAGRHVDGTIRTSYSTGAVIDEQTGTVTGVDTDGRIGGFVGASDSFIHDSYSMGSVDAVHPYAGGFVGRNTTDGRLASSYSTGAVRGATAEGGFIGDNMSGATVTASYWDTDTSGHSTSDGGGGRTTAEMQQASTFSTWDSSVWRFEDGAYPDLIDNPRPVVAP